jgi:glycosyltransferase involved in cell wall biosynthesis
MTICIATSNFLPQVGGIVSFNIHLVRLLTDAGHKVVLIHIQNDTDDEDVIVSKNLFTEVVLRKTYQKIYREWQPYFRPGGFDAPNWIATGMAIRNWLLENHQQYSIDCIEVSDYGGAGIFLCHPSLPRVVVTGHGSLFQYSRYNFAKKDDSFNVVIKMEQLSFSHADAIVTHSLLNQSDLESLFSRKAVLCPMPWLNTNIPSIEQPVANKMVVVGGLQPIKGIYNMIAAMELLIDKAPFLSLNWIGGDTWLAPQQQQMSAYLKKKYFKSWNKNFLWKNELSFAETQKEITTSAIIILPTTFETFNYVALEAAQYKKAIIMTDKAGVAFHFTHGKDAWIIPANNPTALAEAIQYLHTNPELCEQLGENAFNTVQQLFTASTIVNQRILVYKDVIANTENKNKVDDLLNFLNQYRTPMRKFYYSIRQHLKRLIRKT